jgi:hypothetical protein
VGLLGVLAVSSAFAKAAPARTTGPDAFLKQRVYSADQFMQEYSRDPVLRQRLVKHFRMPEAQLTSYLRTELREVSFPESGWTGTYGVKSTGKIYPVKTYVRKGAKALGLADGTPLFKLPCGNPFQTNLPVEAPMAPRQSRKPVEPLPVVAPADGEVALEVASLQSPEEYVLGQDIPQAPVFSVPVGTQGGSHFFFLWPPHFGGGGGGEQTPEPTSLLLLGSGLAVFGGGLLRRRRTR